MCEHTCVPKLLFTKSEAALAIGYKARALDYAIGSGELPVIRHGNRVYVSRQALDDFASKDRLRMTPWGSSTHPANFETSQRNPQAQTETLLLMKEAGARTTEKM